MSCYFYTYFVNNLELYGAEYTRVFFAFPLLLCDLFPEKNITWPKFINSVNFTRRCEIFV